MDKLCDEILERAGNVLIDEENDYLSDSFLDNIIREIEKKANVIDTNEDDNDDIFFCKGGGGCTTNHRGLLQSVVVFANNFILIINSVICLK